MFRATINPFKSIRSLVCSSYVNCHRMLASYTTTGAMQSTVIKSTNIGRKCFSTDNTNVQVAVVSYEYVRDASKQKTKMLIDVREPSELEETGTIPSSINIPLADVEATLNWPNSQFKTKFSRDKPQPQDEIIFYCKLGMRSEKATITAMRLGFTNSKNYRGSWLDWADRNNVVDTRK